MSAAPPLAGVFGWPIGHSLSPVLHGHWLARYRLRGSYLALPVQPEDFETVLRTASKMGFVGANVTLPHKERAAELADTLTPMAQRLGAANTLWFEHGAIHGDNTDGFGFVENLRAGVPDWRPSAGPAVVLGAGGAARAIVAALLDAGVPELRLTNRTKERAERLSDELGGTVIDWAEADDAFEGAALVVNTTSMGMEGGPPLSLTLGAMPEGCVASDIVYVPLETPFLRAAAARGAQTVDGLGMLLHQARPGFARWFGHEPSVDEALREAVLAARSAANA